MAERPYLDASSSLDSAYFTPLSAGCGGASFAFLPLYPFRNAQCLSTGTDNVSPCVAMEDAHAIEVSLDDEDDNGNAFFAVYDGHGGTRPISSSALLPF